MSFDLSPPARAAALITALLAVSALALRLAAELETMGAGASAAEALWSLARYFTNLTNAAVAVIFGLAWLTGRWPGAGWPAAVTVWIVLTGLVYHALLAATHNPVGVDIAANILLHTVVPLAALGLWLVAAPRPAAFLAPVIWTAYPLAYATYAILRGLADGTYPYFFLDPAKSGPAVVAGYVLGLGAVFLITGWALVALGQRLPAPAPAKDRIT